ncbi:hypothetical protein Poli38472_002364 [Pythium oligandrum]|uniref:Uncharacterized protein n=1 Tax=Pythium oligandrum TaxID=41045 RepID=A0A8K1CI68_PYTOL|nr:hypothetical protein Poli38472_002364 [Pythium oligandrum]|eukprot:TMW63423.1 hypothetical protein Poli38472_002364 [Pythium oligandrum]
MRRHDGDDAERKATRGSLVSIAKVAAEPSEGVGALADEVDALTFATRRSAGRESERPEDGDSHQDAVVKQIKRNFVLEAQSYRTRILEATHAAARARERVDDVQNESVRLKKKCFKLQKQLQERDSRIEMLQEQLDFKFPMLMHETMRGLNQVMEDNQDIEPLRPPSTASIRRSLEQAEIVDERIYEYEKQVAQLYEELATEKQKNEMLTECLHEQKQAKAKLMKACKYAKKEIEAMKNSGMTQLLEDLQSRCRGLEADNTRLNEQIASATTNEGELQSTISEMRSQLMKHELEASSWNDRLRAKDDEIEQLRAQVREQQFALENYQQDYDLVIGRKHSNDSNLSRSDLQDECDKLTRVLQRERTRVEELEEELAAARARSADLTDRKLEAYEHSDVPSDPTVAQGLREVWHEVDQVNTKLSSLQTQLVEFGEPALLGLASHAKISSLAPTDWPASDALACVAKVRSALHQSNVVIDGMQQFVEDSYARALGNNCAMQ